MRCLESFRRCMLARVTRFQLTGITDPEILVQAPLFEALDQGVAQIDGFCPPALRGQGLGTCEEEKDKGEHCGGEEQITLAECSGIYE